MNIKPVKSNDSKTWVNAIYEGLSYINDSDISDHERDEINTAMAWVCESLNIQPLISESLSINPIDLEPEDTAPQTNHGYKYHFPDFDTIPAFLGVKGWVDTSYKNDMCPSVENADLFPDKIIKIWTEYADMNMREVDDDKQYYVSTYTNDGDFISGLLVTDNLSEVKDLITTFEKLGGNS